MVEKGILEKRGRGRNTCYVLMCQTLVTTLWVELDAERRGWRSTRSVERKNSRLAERFAGAKASLQYS